jgi:ubiquinone/menaquinone biosynthesis C-methylase UbiE
MQIRRYIALLRDQLPGIALSDNAKVLDVGCGPGALGIAFKHFGFPAWGVDGSRKMAAIAASNGLESRVADATVHLPYPDNSFEVVTAAYLVHGFTREHRAGLFSEMRRVSKNLVLLHDFSPSGNGISLLTITGLLEFLERSDYIDFRRNGVQELEKFFGSVRILPVNRQLSWYICRPVTI